MAACPNCKSQVLDQQLFCRTCGFRFEENFQVSTRSLGLPSERATIPGGRRPRFSSSATKQNRFAIPFVGVMLAMLIGGFSIASIGFDRQIFYSFPSGSCMKAERSYIGVYLTPENQFTTASNGALIDEIAEGGPAEQAGLMSGDKICEIDSQQVYSMDSLIGYLRRTTPGSNITLKVMRDGETFYTTLQTVRRSELSFRPSSSQGYLGIANLQTVQMDATVHVCIGIDHNHDVDSAFENGSELPNIMELSSGVMIGDVVSDSPAERAGIESGDIIMAIDGIPVEDARDLARLIRSKANKSVELAVKRDSQTINVFATIGTRR